MRLILSLFAIAGALLVAACDPANDPVAPPVEEPIEEPIEEPAEQLPLPAPVLSINAGACGDGFVNPGEECDCGAEAPVSPACNAPNGPDGWCSGACEEQCRSAGFANVCAPTAAEVVACRDNELCMDRLRRIEAARGLVRCREQNDFTDDDCEVGYQVQLQQLDEILAVGRQHCGDPC